MKTPLHRTQVHLAKMGPSYSCAGHAFQRPISRRLGSVSESAETATPPLRSLGITDYYLTEHLLQARAAKQLSRLPQCELIFPNVEMRLDVGAKRSFLNIHLLVDPTAPDHIGELQRFMGLLRFEAYEYILNCRRRSSYAALAREAIKRARQRHGRAAEGC